MQEVTVRAMDLDSVGAGRNSRCSRVAEVSHGGLDVLPRSARVALGGSFVVRSASRCSGLRGGSPKAPQADGGEECCPGVTCGPHA